MGCSTKESIILFQQQNLKLSPLLLTVVDFVYKSSTRLCVQMQIHNHQDDVEFQIKGVWGGVRPGVGG